MNSYSKLIKLPSFVRSYANLGNTFPETRHNYSTKQIQKSETNYRDITYSMRKMTTYFIIIIFIVNKRANFTKYGFFAHFRSVSNFTHKISQHSRSVHRSRSRQSSRLRVDNVVTVLTGSRRRISSPYGQLLF